MIPQTPVPEAEEILSDDLSKLHVGIRLSRRTIPQIRHAGGGLTLFRTSGRLSLLRGFCKRHVGICLCGGRFRKLHAGRCLSLFRTSGRFSPSSRMIVQSPCRNLCLQGGGRRKLQGFVDRLFSKIQLLI